MLSLFIISLAVDDLDNESVLPTVQASVLLLISVVYAFILWKLDPYEDSYLIIGCPCSTLRPTVRVSFVLPVALALMTPVQHLLLLIATTNLYFVEEISQVYVTSVFGVVGLVLTFILFIFTVNKLRNPRQKRKDILDELLDQKLAGNVGNPVQFFVTAAAFRTDKLEGSDLQKYEERRRLLHNIGSVFSGYDASLRSMLSSYSACLRDREYLHCHKLRLVGIYFYLHFFKYTLLS